MGTTAPILASVVTFAGSAQFAVASVLGAGGGVAAAVGAAVFLNSRYGPIGVSVATEFDGPVWRRLLAAQLVVDESWAIGNLEEGWDVRRVIGAGLVLYAAWVLGTALGVFFGRVLGSPERLGLDAAFPAMFVALVAPQLTSASGRKAAAIGAAVALALVPFTPPGVPVIAAAVGCLVGLRSR
jgi:4-azaleucine resistance transporter AzlC